MRCSDPLLISLVAGAASAAAVGNSYDNAAAIAISTRIAPSASVSVSIQVAANIPSHTSSKTPAQGAKTSTKTTLKTSNKTTFTTVKTTAKTTTTPAKSTAKASSTTTSVTGPTDPTLIKYVVAPIPKFNGSSAYSTNKPYAESDHFRIWGQKNENTTIGLKHLEGTWDCFVNRLGWRSSGLSAFDYNNAPPYYKTNYFVYPNLYDYGASGLTIENNDGLGYVLIHPDWVNYEGVVSHEFGHVLSIAEPRFWNQSNTYGWRETIAQFVGETYNNSPFCNASRTKYNDTNTDGSLFSPSVVIGQSFKTLVDGSADGNVYQAWPFLSYLTYNLDNYVGFGVNTMRTIFDTYKVNSNETPFHTINRMAATAGTTVQDIVGRYWARMAFVDYGSDIAHLIFRYSQSYLDYNNTIATGINTYKVIPARAPKYMGASIIPLNSTSSSVTATVTAKTAYSAYLAVQGANYGTVRYIQLVATKGTGVVKAASADVAQGESAMLVVANTPANLLLYDVYAVSTGPASIGMNFTFTLNGATA